MQLQVDICNAPLQKKVARSSPQCALQPLRSSQDLSELKELVTHHLAYRQSTEMVTFYISHPRFPLIFGNPQDDHHTLGHTRLHPARLQICSCSPLVSNIDPLPPKSWMRPVSGSLSLNRGSTWWSAALKRPGGTLQRPTLFAPGE